MIYDHSTPNTVATSDPHKHNLIVNFYDEWACIFSSVHLVLVLGHVCGHVHIKVGLEFMRQGTSYDIVDNISTTNVIIMVSYAQYYYSK